MKKIVKNILILLLVSTLIGCGSSSNNDETSKVDSIRIISTTAPVGFNPIVTNDSPSTDVNAQIYETLYLRTTDGTSYNPLLASDMPECNEDGTSCTIKLRENIKFHDGTPFNSKAVKYTIEKIKDPATGAGRASIAASISSIDCIDEYTVKLNLAYPDGVLIAKLAHTNSAIVSPTAYEKQDMMTNPVGTGPYKFVSSISGSEVKLTRNDDYWGTKPEIKDVTYTVITDISTALSRLETQEADFIKTVPESAVGRVKSIANYSTITKQSSAINYLAMRNNSSVNPKMADLNLRIAIAKAIDMESYIASVLGGLGSHSQSILGPTLVGYTKEQENYGYKYDLEGAKKLIQEGGYENEPITFLINNRPTTIALAEFIQSSLQAAGLKNVKIVQQEWASYLSEAKLDNSYDITLLSWSNVTGDGTECLEPNFSTKGGSGRVRYLNDEFDSLVQASKETLDLSKRVSALDAAAKLIVDDAVAVPLYNTYQIFTYSNKYENVNLDPGGTFRINEIKIK